MKLPTRLPDHAKKVFGGIAYDIYQWEQELFDGSITTFEMAKHADAVSVIPIINDKIVIIHESQPRDEERIGFPGGVMDAGETPLQTAQRELLEETGMRFKTFKLVAIDDMGGTKMDWWIYRYVATDLIGQVEPKQDPGEKITSEIVSFERAKELSVGNKFMSLSVMDNVTTLDELRAMDTIEL